VLVLSRKTGEGIMVGKKIKVSVLAIHGRHVKLGISGPADVPIHREEVYRMLQCRSRTGKDAPPLVPITTRPAPPVVPLGDCSRPVDTMEDCW
jgi:carbon storage regulator